MQWVAALPLSRFVDSPLPWVVVGTGLDDGAPPRARGRVWKESIPILAITAVFHAIRVSRCCSYSDSGSSGPTSPLVSPSSAATAAVPAAALRLSRFVDLPMPWVVVVPSVAACAFPTSPARGLLEKAVLFHPGGFPPIGQSTRPDGARHCFVSTRPPRAVWS